MYNPRKLWLVSMAVAAMALVPQSALAQGPEDLETVEVTNEATEQHCGTIVSASQGGCLMHTTSEGGNGVELRKHVFGIESHITTCHFESWGRVNEDSEGIVIHQKLTGPSCARQACKVGGVATPWPGHGDEGEGGAPIEGQEKGTVVLCIEPVGGGTDESCEVDGPGEGIFASDHIGEAGHATEIAGHGTSGFRCEFVGHGQTESGGRLENLMNGELEVAGEGAHITSQTEVP